MDATAAVARVTLLGATATRPVVTPDEVAAIVAHYPIPDPDQRLVTDPAWVPSYDVNAATAEVWRIKAGRVAADFNFAADDARYDKGDVLAHCLAMEAQYASRVGSISGVGIGTNAGTIRVDGTNGPFDPIQRIADQVIP